MIYSLIILAVTLILAWCAAVYIEEETPAPECEIIQQFGFSAGTDVARGYNTWWQTQIYDSYLVEDPEHMRTFCEQIKNYAWVGMVVTKLSVDDMVREWKAHNLMYKLGIFKKHTKSIDFKKTHWYTRLMYRIISLFYVRI